MVSRGGDERGAQERAEPPRPERERPGAHRTRAERERNQRKEVREERKADDRRLAPYSSEQRMMGLLSELGERYRLDFQREYKIRDEVNDWYVTHVDFAWPDEHRLVIEVYGGVHREKFFDRGGTREQDDAARIADVEACGWRALVVHDTELSRTRWPATVAKVERFLDQGRGGAR